MRATKGRAFAAIAARVEEKNDHEDVRKALSAVEVLATPLAGMALPLAKELWRHHRGAKVSRKKRATSAVHSDVNAVRSKFVDDPSS